MANKLSTRKKAVKKSEITLLEAIERVVETSKDSKLESAKLKPAASEINRDCRLIQRI